MQLSLLRTKLHRPATATTSIWRQRLLQRLHEGLAGRVTLASAAAGSGKSTLLSAWLDQLATESPATKAGWLTLEESDNQMPRFLRYLVAAVEESYPHCCIAVTTLLQENPDPSIEAVVASLSNGLHQLSARLVLVLDDLHEIDNSSIYALLAHLVQSAPPTLHLVLSTRIDPPLPLARWRAGGWLNEVRQQELHFTLAEAEAFLEQSLPLPPTAELVEAVHNYTEGWPVGLRLAALALRSQADPAQFLGNVAANSDRYVIDYLCDDVLDQQPSAIQHFLICTAILNRFCAALCAAILQIDETTAQQQLSYVERTNLFLVDLSTPRLWYRYHHQFQSMLLAKLHERIDQPTINALYHRAASWLAAHGAVAEAVGYLMAAGNSGAAADLLEQQRSLLFNEQRRQELSELLALIPVSQIEQRPLLLLTRAWVHSWVQERAQCAATVQSVEHLLATQTAHWTEPTRQLVQLELVALRSKFDSTLTEQESLALIHTAWRQAQPYLASIHSDVIITLAERCLSLGDIDTGLALLSDTMEQSHQWTQLARTWLRIMRGLLHYWNCNLAQAEQDFQTSLHEARQQGAEALTASCQLALGTIALARNQFQMAESLYQPVAANPYLDYGRYAVLSVNRLIDLYAYHGRPEQAQPFVQALRSAAQLAGLRFLHDQVSALEAYLEMKGGDLPRALGWALARSKEPMATTLYSVVDRIPLLCACILMAEGSPASLERACQLLQALSDYQQRQRRWILLAEVQIFQALAWAKLGKLELALAVLAKAVDRAVPNGIVGFFVLQGQPIKELLYTLRNQDVQPPLIDLLLAAFPWQNGAAEADDLLATLTKREIEVLRLMGGGLSNKEIARRLIVSTHTVRNHTANIFSKLQVENRFQAIKYARSRGLLTPL